MDANNSAKRMDNVGFSDHRIFPSRYMIASSDVDRFKDDVCLRPGERSAGNQADQPLTCTDNWQAANSASGSENTVHVFEQTGIFLSACCHGIIQTLTEMRRSGELYVVCFIYVVKSSLLLGQSTHWQQLINLLTYSATTLASVPT